MAKMIKPVGTSSPDEPLFGMQVKTTEPAAPSAPSLEGEKQVPPKSDLMRAYQTWSGDQSQKNLLGLLSAAKPTIDKALTSYAGRETGRVRAQAKLLAVKAFKTYDPSRKTKLTTHLMWQLKPLTRIARERSQMLKLPERVFFDKMNLDRAAVELEDKHDRPATDAELSDYTGLSERRIAYVRALARPEMLESSLQTDEGEEFRPGTSGPDTSEIWADYVYRDLSPIDQKIFEWRTGKNNQPILGVVEIGRRLKMSPASVSQRSKRINEMLANEGEV